MAVAILAADKALDSDETIRHRHIYGFALDHTHGPFPDPVAAAAKSLPSFGFQPTRFRRAGQRRALPRASRAEAVLCMRFAAL